MASPVSDVGKSEVAGSSTSWRLLPALGIMTQPTLPSQPSLSRDLRGGICCVQQVCKSDECLYPHAV